ncbi:MarR family transcriptional regulator [Cohnella sp. CFH 77786]|uniref:MarR family winged helix-turn-helix transcriptional regulator n=1 Tax=Cohnella sp. CFH 77786 TaxID=2662265 RepID=UPI001C60ADE5|nr:MarR family transcriptional regulator [Cohnella sp. CFH 77786]MBW5447601.1 MarR family transcriptional regulator [Cohnella sp. CFH 77786]
MNTRYSQEAGIFLQLYWVNKMIGTKFEASTGASQTRLEILSVLYQVDEISQSDLQKKVNIDSAAITRHVKQLEAGGMVLRRRKSEDNRIILVCLTDHGREQIGSSLEVKERFMKEVLANVSAEERRVLENVLSQMRKNLESLNAQPDPSP